MKRTTIRPASIIVIALIVMGIVLVMRAQAVADYVQHTWESIAGPVTTPSGPEADPYLRHAPGGYDYELEPPPEEILP